MNYSTITKEIKDWKTGNSKLTDIAVFSYIKFCSDHESHISHITEHKLAHFTGLSERSIRRSINKLRDLGVIEVASYTITKDEGFITRNSYKIVRKNRLDHNFFMVNRAAFFQEMQRDSKIVGFIFLIKSICLNKTNKTLWPLKRIATEIGISYKTATKMMEQCITQGYIKENKDSQGYEIIENWFIENTLAAQESWVYNEIAKFCIERGVKPPKVEKKPLTSISWNITHWRDLEIDYVIDFRLFLNKQFPTLPKTVNLMYFVKGFGLVEEYKKIKSRPKKKTHQSFAF